MSCKNKNNVCILVTICLCAHSSVILLFIPSLPRNSGNKLQNDPLVSAETVCHSSTYIILYWFYYATILTFDVRYNQTPLWHWSWNLNTFEPYLPTLVWHLRIYLAMCPCLLIIADYVLARFIEIDKINTLHDILALNDIHICISHCNGVIYHNEMQRNICIHIKFNIDYIKKHNKHNIKTLHPLIPSNQNSSNSWTLLFGEKKRLA